MSPHLWKGSAPSLLLTSSGLTLPTKTRRSGAQAWLAAGKQACRPPWAGSRLLQSIEGSPLLAVSTSDTPQIRLVAEGPLSRGEGGT